MSSMIVKYRLVKLFWSFLLFLTIFALCLHVLFTKNQYSTSNANSDLYFKAPPLETKNVGIEVEKYNEHLIRTRIMQEKINHIRQLNTKAYATKIIYHAPVKWFRKEHDQHLSNFNRIYNYTFVLYKDQQEYINVAYFPKRGFYNMSREILTQHYQEISNLGVNVIVWNWFPSISHELAITIFQILSDMKMKCIIQIDSYRGRSAQTIRDNIVYFTNNFENYQSWNKYYVISKKKSLPMFYIKDAYELHLTELKELFAHNNKNSIRGTKHDAIIIGHFLLDAPEDKTIIRRSGVDGFYSHSAINGAHYVSTWKNWQACFQFAKKYNLIFISTIGPGYQDKIKERSNKIKNMRFRSNGEYYGVGWRSAKKIDAQFVLLNSYNDFVHGTQIEPVLVRSGFADYAPYESDHYLRLTKYQVKEFYKDKLAKNPKTCDDFLNNTIC
uniref:CSON013532 protein n=1 Tax=Culicoides sonorensis TaxID=179676 RepID=A0A336M8J0_CULSO